MMLDLSIQEFTTVIERDVASVDFFQEYYVNRDRCIVMTAMYHRTCPAREGEDNTETLLFRFEYEYDESHKATWRLTQVEAKGHFSRLERAMLCKVAHEELHHIFVLLTESVLDDTYERHDKYGIRAFASDLEEIVLS